jgi:predicted phage terminase large subunit-like protein
VTLSWAQAAADAFDPPPLADHLLSPVNYAVHRSRGQFRDFPHIRVMERAILETIATGGRLIISASVRHGKSQIASRWLPAWFIGRNPDKRIILGGHEHDFAARWGRAARDILREYGAEDFGIEVSKDSEAANRWDIHRREGGMLTVGVGGSPIGRGADGMIVDDPIKSYKDAMSPLVRERQKEWLTGTMFSRIEPGGWMILLMARWHEDDPAGFLLEKDPENWRELRLPARCDDPATDPLGRELNEPLWPERWPAEALAEREREVSLALGRAVWFAQYQGRPQPPEGGMFPEAKWRFMRRDELPDRLRWVRAWDLAATKDAGDFTVGVRMARLPDGRFVIDDVVRGQWEGSEWRTQMKAAQLRDPAGTQVELPQDPGQAGKDQGKQLVALLAGSNVHARPQTGSKEVRASGYAAQQQASNVLLVEADWNGEWVAEHRDFPRAAHDDQVDAGSTAFNALMGISRPGVRFL